jgi:hypothetical protein
MRGSSLGFAESHHSRVSSTRIDSHNLIKLNSLLTESGTWSLNSHIYISSGTSNARNPEPCDTLGDRLHILLSADVGAHP